MKKDEIIRILGDTTLCTPLGQAAFAAIEDLKKLQQYQAIGTVEEIKEVLQIISEGQNDVDESGISVGLLHILLEYAKYKKIGTVEECRAAMEKHKEKKLVYYDNCSNKALTSRCPSCFELVTGKYCEYCGQAILWEEDKE